MLNGNIKELGHKPTINMKRKEGYYQWDTLIEHFIAAKDKSKEAYTAGDIHHIQQYEGMGKQGRDWSTKEVGEGILYEYFTPPYVVELMWELAWYYGYESGTILEPSIGTGRMLQPLKKFEGCVGFEPNGVNARISEISCPGASIYNHHFETAFLDYPRFTTRIKNPLTWLDEYPFSLVIGNPPYGIYKNYYSKFFPEARKMKQIEIFFIYKCLQLLKPNGLLVFIIGSNFLRNGSSYNSAKVELATMCDLLDAYRLPPVFKFSEIPTDIIVLRRK